MHLQRRSILALVAAGCSACNGAAAARGASPDSSAAQGRDIPAVAFRLPSRGGALSVYQLPGLRETPWGTGGRTAGAREAIGADMQGRRLVYRDSTGAVASLDLVALRERAIAPRGALVSLGSDGTLLAVDSSGTVLESQAWGIRPWSRPLGRGVRALFAAPGGRALAVRSAGADTLALLTRETGVTRKTWVPDAVSRAASFEGDAVAFATDSGVVVVEERETDRPWFARIAGRPRTVAFSPSGHRIYATLSDRSELAVLDRFTRRERSSISLPGPAAAIRTDPWGRAILAQPAGDQDSQAVWVVGVAEERVIGRLSAGWSSDLPAVAESGVLLTREGTDVVARDVRDLDLLGVVSGGAGDLWFTGRWVAHSTAAAARQAASESAPATPRRSPEPERPRQQVARERSPAPEPPPVASAPPQPVEETGNFWVQVTSTRFEDGARGLAADLRREGHPSQVVAPRPGQDIWRVMTGPYRSRQAADSAGRSLGRPYFIVDRPRQ